MSLGDVASRNHAVSSAACKVMSVGRTTPAARSQLHVAFPVQVSTAVAFNRSRWYASAHRLNARGKRLSASRRPPSMSSARPPTRLATTGTPRRLALIVEGLADRQEDRLREVTGPAVRVAYDASGKPTNAALALMRLPENSGRRRRFWSGSINWTKLYVSIARSVTRQPWNVLSLPGSI